MNNSDIIRWSLDLRWQRADRDVGFYDLKQGVRMRSSTDADLAIDWDSFNAVTRHDRHKQVPETTWHDTSEASRAVMYSIKIENTNAHTQTQPFNGSCLGLPG